MQRAMNERDGRASVFVRMVCCRLLCFLGYITAEQESKGMQSEFYLFIYLFNFICFFIH
jgi:hypothetical protein